MKVLAINNGRDHTAYTLIEGDKRNGYTASSSFLKGNITQIKDLCWHLQPDRIVLQLPPTGLDNRTQHAVRAGFGRNVLAAGSSIGQFPIIKNLLSTRSALGCYSREDVRELFGYTLECDHLQGLNRRQQMQILNTVTLAYEEIKAAERYTS